MKWVVATGNPGKAEELVRLLGVPRAQVATLRELELPSPPEEAPTFVENALTKARHAAQASGRIAVADDSGLAVEALGGEPGVRSARFAGDEAGDEDNNRLLVERLEATGPGPWAAVFHCVAVCLRAGDDPAPVLAHGRWHGRIVPAARGDRGFGYDPLFEDPELGRTAAELAAGEKDARSHRGRAMKELERRIREERIGA